MVFVFPCLLMWEKQMSWGGYCLICFSQSCQDSLEPSTSPPVRLWDYWSSTDIKKIWVQVCVGPWGPEEHQGQCSPRREDRQMGMTVKEPEADLGWAIIPQGNTGFISPLWEVADGGHVPILGTVKHPGGGRCGMSYVEVLWEQIPTEQNPVLMTSWKAL